MNVMTLGYHEHLFTKPMPKGSLSKPAPWFTSQDPMPDRPLDCLSEQLLKNKSLKNENPRLSLDHTANAIR
jgi:hypothetical protein